MRYEIGKILKKDKVMELVSGNCFRPKRLLGRHLTERGQMIAAYHPEAVQMWLLAENGDIYQMDMVERQPIFALFLPHREKFSYRLKIRLADGVQRVYHDPYSFPCQITGEEQEAFAQGTWMDAYKKMGCHPMEIQGVRGMYFVVWAPQTKAVSLVGDFNQWDRRICPMNRVENTDLYEIFVPGASEGQRYRYEMKTIRGDIWKVADTYGFSVGSKEEHTSKILNISDFAWEDKAWMDGRCRGKTMDNPVIICNISEKRKEEMDSALENVFTHVLISSGQSGEKMLQAAYSGKKGFFVPPLYEENPREFQRFVQDAHKKGIGVFLEVYFEAFHYDRPETSDYMFSNLLFWIREYHIDGFVFEGMAELSGEKGDVQEPEADAIRDIISFKKPAGEKKRQEIIRRAVDVIRREAPDVTIIANERKKKRMSGRPHPSEQQEIDLVWNYEIGKKLNRYLDAPEEERKKEHFNLTLPLQKGGLGHSLLLLEYKDMDRLCQTSIDKMDEVYYDKLSEAKLYFAFLIGVPGKKILPDYCTHSRACVYLHSLLEMYRAHPALYENGGEEKNFEWINGMDAEASVISFLRKSPADKKSFLFLCNFSKMPLENYSVGVPVQGEYRLVSNSDEERFGGRNRFTKQILNSVEKPRDFRPYSVAVALPPESALIFEFEPE
ncbi:MAG: alpha amylase C-terminal domain-containing protein [Eubacteriales bacterium]|nr:alpha amylase C-terminal domain-containing protein [Eubacteriales bacterium]